MNYTVPLRYFFLMSILLIVTGIWMFALHTSFSIDETIKYYEPKTFFGLLETVSPHLFGMGLLVFIYTHFFAIIKEKKTLVYTKFVLVLFLMVLVSNISGFFISEDGYVLAFIKLSSTVFFVIYSLWALIKVHKLL